jgi:hypothetical protein
VNELDSIGDPEFLNDLLSVTALDPQRSPLEERSEAGDDSSSGAKSAPASDAILQELTNEVAEQFRLREILEEACVVTGATGAAVALARGNEMLCRATAGADAPDLGVCLDPRSGLSGSCIQTRQMQQCPDTETDPRVDAEACRLLGVRSIVVLPLLRGNDLEGILEILSSRPNAFGPGDLGSLQTLSRRILERKGQDSATPAPPGAPGSLLKVEELGARNKHHPSSDPGISRIPSTFRRNEIWTAVLGVLVIGVAVLLGMMVGWRLGWRKATLQMHDNSHRSSVPSAGRTKESPPPAVESQPGTYPSETSGRAADRTTSQGASDATPHGTARPPVHPPRGAITIHQGGKVIFSAPPSAPPSAGEPQPAQPSAPSNADPSH